MATRTRAASPPATLTSPASFYLLDSSDGVGMALHQLLAGGSLCSHFGCTGGLIGNEVHG